MNVGVLGCIVAPPCSRTPVFLFYISTSREKTMANQDLALMGILGQFAKRDAPVIPVILPEQYEEP